MQEVVAPEYQAITRAILNGRAILFLGAGVNSAGVPMARDSDVGSICRAGRSSPPISQGGSSSPRLTRATSRICSMSPSGSRW